MERLRERLARIDIWPGYAALVVGATSVLIVALIGLLVWLSLLAEPPLFVRELSYGLGNYGRLMSDPFVWRIVLNTIVFSLVATLSAITLGVSAAWVIERTTFRHKTLVYTVVTLGMVLPGFLVGIGWFFLLEPNGGIINRALDPLGITIDVTSLAGMGLLEGLMVAPVAFIMTAAAFRQIDATGEEAAAMSGASLRKTVWRVTLPTLKPSLYGAAIYVVILCFGAFDIPAILGLRSRTFVFSTYMYELVSPQAGRSQYQIAATIGVIMVLIGLGLSYLYGRLIRSARRFATVSGKTHRATAITLGPIGHGVALGSVIAYGLVAVVLPALALLWVAITPVQTVPSVEALGRITLRNFEQLPWTTLLTAAGNTAALMLIVPTVVIFFVALPFTWVVLRSRFGYRAAVDQVAFVPHVIPNIVFSLAVLLFGLFVVRGLFPFNGTIWILVLAFVVAYLSFATRMTNNAWIQLGPELEEAATMSGARWLTILRRVVVPLLSPALVSAWLWIALLTYRQLTIPVLLTGVGNVTFPMAIFNIWMGSSVGQAAAASLVFAVALAPLVALYWRFARGRALAA